MLSLTHKSLPPLPSSLPPPSCSFLLLLLLLSILDGHRLTETDRRILSLSLSLFLVLLQQRPTEASGIPYEYHSVLREANGARREGRGPICRNYR